MSTITIIDTDWVGRSSAVACALLESEGHRALVDPGPASTLSTLRAKLNSRGIAITQLDAVLLTHIHLDHAGATGWLARENPRLTVYVHKNGAPHLIDPAKLLASAGRLWGDDLLRLFGDTLPVPEANLHILEGGETLELGGRKLGVAYTPGHASHHVSYFDDVEGVAFVGDTAGVRIENGPYILPATPPPDIDLALWDSSFAAILAHRPTRLFLTHFGFAENPPAHIMTFRERLHRWVSIADKSIEGTRDEAVALEAFVKITTAEIVEQLGQEEAERYVFTAGLNLSFLGMARYLRKRAKAAS
jgi:glyoxylase-like metal-dependent hydrolase (beta-lactamase superfamily II)